MLTQAHTKGPLSLSEQLLNFRRFGQEALVTYNIVNHLKNISQ